MWLRCTNQFKAAITSATELGICHGQPMSSAQAPGPQHTGTRTDLNHWRARYAAAARTIANTMPWPPASSGQQTRALGSEPACSTLPLPLPRSVRGRLLDRLVRPGAAGGGPLDASTPHALRVTGRTLSSTESTSNTGIRLDLSTCTTLPSRKHVTWATSGFSVDSLLETKPNSWGPVNNESSLLPLLCITSVSTELAGSTEQGE